MPWTAAGNRIHVCESYSRFEYFHIEVSIDYLLGVTEIRKPYTLCYDDNEEDLLDTYRALGPQEQIYLLKQAHMYCQHDLSAFQEK